MGSDHDATTFPHVHAYRGPHGVLLRIEQRGQLHQLPTSSQSGTMDEAGVQKAFTAGLAGKASDIGKVALWVGKNCKM